MCNDLISHSCSFYARQWRIEEERGCCERAGIQNNFTVITNMLKFYFRLFASACSVSTGPNSSSVIFDSFLLLGWDV